MRTDESMTTPPHPTGTEPATSRRVRAWSALAVAGLFALGACGDGTDGDETPPAAEQETTDPADDATDDTGDMADDDAQDGGPVTLAEAEVIALADVGEGEVTWSGPEDDRGAAWEVEVTRDDGSEVDVLVDAYGRIVP